MLCTLFRYACCEYSLQDSLNIHGCWQNCVLVSMPAHHLPSPLRQQRQNRESSRCSSFCFLNVGHRIDRDCQVCACAATMVFVVCVVIFLVSQFGRLAFGGPQSHAFGNTLCSPMGAALGIQNGSIVLGCVTVSSASPRFQMVHFGYPLCSSANPGTHRVGGVSDSR